ncbi:MAG: response regulator [Alphaproteobacteria bacterium]
MAQILLIDDETEVRESTEMVLIRAGHDVTSCDRADAGLEQLRGGSFDLVITDIVMPEKDGVAFLRELGEINPDQKAMAISGGAKQMPAAFGLQMAKMYGSDGVLFKPFTPDELNTAVNKLLDA